VTVGGAYVSRRIRDRRECSDDSGRFISIVLSASTDQTGLIVQLTLSSTDTGGSKASL